jgi:basic membrane protein A
VVTHHTDSTATVQAAEERGKYAIAYHSDMSKFAPKAHLAAVTHHWGKQYTEEARAVLNNTWRTHAVWGGIKDGMVKLEGWGPTVSADVKELVQSRQQAIVAGKLTPFDAPLKDNQGKVRLSKGSLTDEELSKMDYYVEGVVGRGQASNNLHSPVVAKKRPHAHSSMRPFFEGVFFSKNGDYHPG